MYQLLRKESRKPPLQIAEDNWPRMAFGLLSVVSLNSWRTDIFTPVSTYIKKTFTILTDHIHPDEEIYPYVRPITVLAIMFVSGAAITFFERFSNLILAVRPSDRNDHEGASPVHQRTDKESAMLETRETSSATWSFWRPSTLTHAEWMYKYSLFSIISLSTYTFMVRNRVHLPNLWPWIWNNPYWIDFLRGIFISLEEERAHLTVWQSLYAVIVRVLMTPILSRLALRVFIMDLKEEPRTWWGGKKDPKDWTVTDRAMSALERNLRTMADHARRGWKVAGPWLARNWPKLALFGLSIRWCMLSEDMWKIATLWISDVWSYHLQFKDPRDRQAIVYPSFGVLAAILLPLLWLSAETFSNVILSVRVPFRHQLSKERKEDEAPLTGTTDTPKNRGLIRHAKIMYMYTIASNASMFAWIELDVYGRLLAWIRRTTEGPFLKAVLDAAISDRSSRHRAVDLILSRVSWWTYIKYHMRGQFGMAIMVVWTLRTLLKDLRGEPRTWWGGDQKSK
ncbi:hypothetical protein EMPS_00070 [Entomortierella parvispora]|uniref:Uncharacterized protein n=1 Tax=Entomortierella parvispora TaxID=205924 RepID=A0A9P3GZ59_9FUNG|nr:hypothetical protein EMPS_00070 [Entomortierella parvispora]